MRINACEGKLICTTTIYRYFMLDGQYNAVSATFLMDMISNLYLVQKDFPCIEPYTSKNGHVQITIHIVKSKSTLLVY